MNIFHRVTWIRNLFIWKYCTNYFPIDMVKTVDLTPNRNYLICLFPHGLWRWVILVFMDSITCFFVELSIIIYLFLILCCDWDVQSWFWTLNYYWQLITDVQVIEVRKPNSINTVSVSFQFQFNVFRSCVFNLTQTWWRTASKKVVEMWKKSKFLKPSLKIEIISPYQWRKPVLWLFQAFSLLLD